MHRAANRNPRREVSDELVRRGYRRVDRMHLLHVVGEWHLWVDMGPLGKCADISPWVGVRCDVLERSVGEFLSLPPDDSVGSLGANVGYIIDGQYRAWDESASSLEVLEVIDAALARLRPLLSFDRLAEGWKIEGTRDPIWRYREITLLFLQRDTAQVRSKLEEARPEFSRYEDAMAAQFRKFEQRVLTGLKTA